MTQTTANKTTSRIMSLQEYVQWLLDNEPEYFYAKIFEAEAEGEE